MINSSPFHGIRQKINPSIIDTAAAVAILADAARINPVSCPTCGHIPAGKAESSFFAARPVYCGECKTAWTWRSGTPFFRSKIAAPQALLMALLVDLSTGKKITVADIARMAALNPATVGKWRGAK